MWLCIFILTLSYSDAYKTLVVFPIPDQTHSILGAAFVKHLLNYGYEVTYITPYPEKHPHPNLEQVDVSQNLDLLPETSLNITSFMNQDASVQDFKETVKFMNLVAKKTLESENVQKLLKDPSKEFQMAVFEWNLSELLIGIAAVYNVPFIWVSNVEPHSLVTRLVDSSFDTLLQSDTPLKYVLPLPYTLYEGVDEFWTQVSLRYYIWNTNKNVSQDYDNIFAPIIKEKGRELPLFDEFRYFGSFVYVNTHSALGHAMRLPENYKNIGGYHVEEEVKPLTPKLSKIMENSKDGAIYFSMGSKLKSEDLPIDIKRGLMKVFGELKQTVLWKINDSSIDVPNNVHILKQAPQQSLLAHPNCVLFITNGDRLSTIEAIYYGVPMIGIPVYGDQFVNIEKLTRKGVARRVNLSNSLVGDLREAIDEVLTTKRYNTSAKELSYIFTHRPATTGAEIVHWIEHAIITQGARHLRSYNMPLLWLTLMFLLTLTVIMLGAILLVFKFIFNSNKKTVELKKKKK